eukprot:1148092-Amorphochlora_amoeboformis.AAC.1
MVAARRQRSHGVPFFLPFLIQNLAHHEGYRRAGGNAKGKGLRLRGGSGINALNLEGKENLDHPLSQYDMRIRAMEHMEDEHNVRMRQL